MIATILDFLVNNLQDIFLSIGALIISYIIYFYISYFTRSNPLPGPLPLPIVGNLLAYPGDAGKWAQELHKKYGDIYEVYLGTARTVWLNRSDLVEKIMSSSHTNHFHYRTGENDGLDELDITGKGVFFNNIGKDLNYHRKIYDKTIMTPQFGKNILPVTQSLFKQLESLWKDYKCFEENREIDFSSWMQQFGFESTLKLVTHFHAPALINYYNSLNPKQKVTKIPEDSLSSIDTERFINCIKSNFDSWCFFLLIPKYLRRTLEIRTNNYLLREIDWLYSNVLNIIKLRKSQIENSSIDELPHHPKVLQQIHQELENVLGTNTDSEITFEDLNKLKYCEAVINEVGRLWPILPVNLRISSKPDTIDNHKFPANQQFFINQQDIQLNPKDWDNPEVFNPSRFLSSDDTSKRNKNALLIFGGGLRTCKHFALIQMKTLMALIYRKYDIELVDPTASIKYRYCLIRQCTEMKIKIKQRRNI
ncbi:6682_t:CDS:2 [Diversispora eburnea]|uniref:6682_t:CDS:1 n=1 Tax=Diversispora eburnea TaxID=1213867 RepID=A0A9N8V3X5_9GLOM|nr:6682_t:CDS:2 [Diversispora eburnea]